MAVIELKYIDGNELYTCSECGNEINEALIEDYIYEKARLCPNCGSEIDDVDLY